MSKKTLAALAVLGMSSFLGAEEVASNSACTSSSCGQVLAAANSAACNATMPADQQAFCNKMNSSSQAAFKAMNAEGRAMAMKIAAQECKGKNDCKGKGGCKTETHACAGKNECKGKGGAPMKDANKAVEMASNCMASKRAHAND
jgi:hypothetical protein